ncbi:MAG: NAD(P) transhydrogenase subunit alpha [Erysipelothrix sp.]|nr:NAD(P) transhydrogenase subunit alpha [Erysipelothrix sp.]
MIIGVPREIMNDENRVAATPTTIKAMIADGHEVLVEKDAGIGSYFSDADYEQVGARILDDVRELYARADLILKVKEPLYHETLQMHEVDMMHPGQHLISFIHPASPSNHAMVTKLAQAGVVALTLDGVPRISRAQSMDALTSMSTCAGYKGMLMAACEYAGFVPQIFSAAGGSKPAKVLVVGAGVAGLQALATAKRLGAQCFALDIRATALEQAVSLGAKPVESGIPESISVGEGGYAKALSDAWLLKERAAIAAVLPEVDIVYLSALVPGEQAPILIDADMVQLMKPGSVIMDVSIDQGGNCALTQGGQTIKAHHVTISGIKNIPARLAVSATTMLAHNMLNLLKYFVQDNAINLDLNDEVVQGMLVCAKGEIVHEGTLAAMQSVTS